MRLTKDSLILVGVLVGVVALTAPVSARIVPKPQIPYTYVAPATSDTSATTTTATTAESIATTTVISPPAIAAQPSTVLNNLAVQLNSLLQQLITLLTVQIQQLQAQLAAIQAPGQAATTPSAASTAAAPTTTAQTAATATATAVAVENKLPRVNITYPYSGLEFTASASTDVTASALDEDGSISKVEFFAGGTSLGTSSGSKGPWSVRWSGISADTYTLTAKATDDKGSQTTSAPVTLKVKALGAGATGFTDSPPTVTIAGFGATASSGQTISIVATASTYAGSISQVVFYKASSNTAATIATDVASPFQVSTTVGVTGAWTLSASATNSQGSVTNSGSSTINIGPN